MRAFEALAAKSTAVLCERSNIAKEEEEMYYAVVFLPFDTAGAVSAARLASAASTGIFAGVEEPPCKRAAC